MADVEMIDICSNSIKNTKKRCIEIISGLAGANFVPMNPEVQAGILRFPELQDEWRAVAPLYFEAKMRSEGQMNALATSPANVTTSASTSVAPLATRNARLRSHEARRQHRAHRVDTRELHKEYACFCPASPRTGGRNDITCSAWPVRIRVDSIWAGHDQNPRPARRARLSGNLC